MVRDPLYRSIEKGLEERLDPDLFERCAVELLRDVYPGIVPVRGGDDGGMDGSISIGTGSPLPLITTTGKGVLGNLTRNLGSYRRTGGSAPEAVLATSRSLTPRRRRNLEQRARELGFTLRHVHDRDDFVGRLYRNPIWRRQLLGLAGDPPALSALPDKAGSRLTLDLLGRERELDWLRRASGDVVVVGQPGVGKTALLEALAREGGGLFPRVTWTGGATAVTSGDRRRIADAVRAQRPPRIFIDDAHLKDSLIQCMTRMRDDIGAEFAIVATTWPSREEEVGRELHCPSRRFLRVEGLDRRTASKIVRQAHGGFPDELVGEILDQSVDNLPGGDPLTAEYHAGGHVRPGLAVTLARYATQGDLAGLARGDLLLSELRKDAQLAGPQLDHLAVFALGGAAGMRLAAAAEALGTAQADVRQSLLQVSGTGVLRDIRGGAAAIHPRHLRHALVKGTFFSGASSLTPEPAIDCAEDAAACTATLIGVLATESSLDHEARGRLHGLIKTRLEKQDSPYVGSTLWASYARTGAEAAGWILDEHPGRTILVSGAALRHAPDRFLGGLVSRALGHPREADALTRSIRAWVLAGRAGADAVERRETLVHALAERGGGIDLRQAGRRLPAELLAAAFSLSFETSRDDPIKIMEISISFGSLPACDVREIGDLWALALPVLHGLGRSGVSCARNVVHDWLVGPHAGDELDEAQVAAREQIRRMLPTVLDLAGHEPGILLWAHRLANAHRLDVRLPEVGDSALRQLFPNPAEVESADDSQVRLDATARTLGRKWRNEGPEAVVARLMHYERQRDLMGHYYPDALELLPLHLAQHADDPGTWIEELVDRDAPPGWVVPFLEAAAVIPAASERAWEAVARDDRYTRPCVAVGLRVAGLPRAIVDRIMEQVKTWTEDMLSRWIDWNTVEREWQYHLLRHPEPAVRGAVAGCIWVAGGKHRPGGRLGPAWEDAVVAWRDSGLMSELLRAHAGIARAWILSEAQASSVRRRNRRSASEPDPSSPNFAEWEARVEQHLNEPSLDEGLLRTAKDRLGLEDRRNLIGAIPEDANPMFFDFLAAGDPDLSALLLGRPAAKHVRRAPLREATAGEREALVQEATQHGYSGRVRKLARWRRQHDGAQT